MKFCIVTPYYKEDRRLLERCIGSVKAQTLACDHLMVADGFPVDWIDGAGVRHLRLDRAHGDYGNFARGVGALAASIERYDAVAFLDADNWFDPDHMALCWQAAAAAPGGADLVFARRRFRRPDGSVIPGMVKDEYPFRDHVDTNCFFVLEGAYHMLHRWSSMPPEMSIIGDYLFLHMCLNEKLRFVSVIKRTVNYQCMFQNVYEMLGEAPPPGCKPPIDSSTVQNWLDSLSPARFADVQRRTGLHLRNA
jgi:glycosyltransferase involved in cell wall biosynthesis